MFRFMAIILAVISVALLAGCLRHDGRYGSYQAFVGYDSGPACVAPPPVVYTPPVVVNRTVVVPRPVIVPRPPVYVNRPVVVDRRPIVRADRDHRQVDVRLDRGRDNRR